MSIVSKEEYWTTILNDYSQFDQITTEDSEFNSIANDVWNVLENSFIKIDDEESIIKWEEMAGLSGEGLTIFQRKVNILYTLTIKNYLPISLFTQAMNRLVGEENYIITFNEDTQKYEVETYEEYETSVSFLNKRLANGRVDLETTSLLGSGLPNGYLAIQGLQTNGASYVALGKGLINSEQSHDFSGYVTGGIIMGTSASGYDYLWVGVGSIVWGGYICGHAKDVDITIDGEAKSVTYHGNTYFKPTVNFTSEEETAIFGVGSGSRILHISSAESKFYHWLISQNGKKLHEYIPVIDSAGVACVFDKIEKKTFYNGAGSQFVAILTLEQALKLASLPAGGGSLAVNLPWEAQLVQHNAEVEAALQTAKSNGWTITVQYCDPEPDNAVYNKYAQCVVVADMQAVNADYKKDLTFDGEWVYPLPKLQNASWAFNTFEKCKAWLVDLPSLENGEFMLVRYAGTVFDRALPLLENGESMFRNMVGRKTFKSALPRLKNGIRMFAGVATYGIVYLSFESDLPMLEKGLGMFDLNALDKASVLRICSSIPTYTSGTHELTLGIHIDHQTDDEVLSAIAEAEAKGWIMTVQWNGTPTAQTASTFGLRKPPIYAKVGSMVLPNGTTEQYLDWGHYVTNAEENGYQEFGSVEEAKEHFNIGD